MIPKWTAEVTEAERKRGSSVNAMDIYQARVPKPKGRKEIEVELGQQELERILQGRPVGSPMVCNLKRLSEYCISLFPNAHLEQV